MIGMSRKEEKKRTRRRILQCALEAFRTAGYTGTNTLSIAACAGVAHGTVFLHFGTKEQLLFEIIEERLLKVSNQLRSSVKTAGTLEALLRIHLDFINDNLDFESMLARELPVMPDNLRRRIFTIQGGIIDDFYRVLETGIESGNFRKTDPAVALNFWFGTLNYYLANQELFAKPEAIIRAKGEAMINFFIQSLRSN